MINITYIKIYMISNHKNLSYKKITSKLGFLKKVKKKQYFQIHFVRSNTSVRTLLSTHLSNTLIDFMHAYIHISHSALIRE